MGRAGEVRSKLLKGDDGRERGRLEEVVCKDLRFGGAHGLEESMGGLVGFRVANGDPNVG